MTVDGNYFFKRWWSSTTHQYQISKHGILTTVTTYTIMTIMTERDVAIPLLINALDFYVNDADNSTTDKFSSGVFSMLRKFMV